MIESSPEHTIRELAEQEAALYTVPANWRVGRQLRVAAAIDAAPSPDIDDALDVTTNADASRLLHVGIIDVGSFLYNQPRIVARAIQDMRTRYNGPTVGRPMIPARLSEDILSFTDGQERPAITSHITIAPSGEATGMTLSKERLVARRLTYETVDRAVRSPETIEGGQMFRDLYHVGRGLYWARHNNNRLDLRAEDEDGVPLNEFGTTASRIIVQESMICLGGMISVFADTHGIPVINRAHFRANNPDIPEELRQQRGRAFFTVKPQLHETIGHYYARIGSPLRRIEDFVNQANVSAYMDGRDFPFPEDILEDIAASLSRLENRDMPKSQGTHVSQGSRSRHATTILGKFETGTVRQNDLVDAIFGDLRGPTQKLIELDEKAMEHIAANIHLAKAVIEEAKARKLITIVAVNPDDQADRRRKLIDQFGNEHTFKEQRKGSLPAMLAYTRLLSHVTGVKVEPQIPAHLTQEGRIFANGDPFLRKLSRNNELQYLTSEPAIGPTGEVEIHVSVIINGVKHTRVGRGSKEAKAITQAAGVLIADLDLIDNPPPPRAHLVKAVEEARRAKKLAETIPGNKPDAEKVNPIVQLKKLLDKRGGTVTKYALEPVLVEGGSPPRMRCMLSVTDTAGKELHRVEAEESSIKSAKQAAAQWLFDSLTTEKTQS